ncbi:MAG: hypothetical protein K8R38_07065 [Verrucomicrobia bacterium]|nr:hypothetical protein [Verrucomicrobiota bacterium]
MSKDSNDHSYPLMRGNPVAILLSAWISLSAMVVLLGWGFSFLRILDWVWIPDVLALLTVIALALRSWRWVSLGEREVLLNTLLFPPFLLLAVLIGFAIALYPPETHDSLSYRIPRMLLWLQDGWVAHLPVSDERINSMTHVWEFLALPMMKVSGDSFLELPSLISWGVSFIVFWDFSRCLGADPRRAAWIGIIPASATGFVLQAAGTSNDLLATTFILSSVWFAAAFHKMESCPRAYVLLSALSLALGAGTKPHFIVLGLPWVIWFFAAPGRPWRVLRMIDLLWAIPTGLIVSPLPAFLMNRWHYGSLTGPVADILEGSHDPIANLSAASVMMIWQQLQLPLNPLARSWNKIQEQWIESVHWRDKVPKFSLDIREIPMVDNASLGIVVTAAMTMGIIVAFRNRRTIPRWCWWCLASGVFGFCIAASKVVPSTVGRSFLGFLMLACPIALAGMTRLSSLTIKVAALCSVTAAAVVLVICPAHPLWPVGLISNHLGESSMAQLQKYRSFTERYYAGADLIACIPSNSSVGVLAGAGEPLVQLWQPYGAGRRVIFHSPGTNLAAISGSETQWLLAAGLAHELHAPLLKEIAASASWHEVARKSYVSELSRGPQEWILYHTTP